MTAQASKILFEPWAMGDAIIAAAVAGQMPASLVVACNSRWHRLLRAAAKETAVPQLLAVDLAYTNRGRSSRFELGQLPIHLGFDEVITIRGDVRDILAARGIFRGATVRTTGWYAFAARRSAILDAPFSLGWLRPRNRYRAWCDVVGLPWTQIYEFYRRQIRRGSKGPVVIHVGAQWRSKQYPDVAGLCTLLRGLCSVQLVSGLGDPLPSGVHDNEVSRLQDEALVEILQQASLVIVNDSGPMHLAAFLRCQVLAISRVSGIAEWLPPFVEVVLAKSAPRGYRPAANYMSDSVLDGWPTPREILSRATSMLGLNPVKQAETSNCDACLSENSTEGD